MVQSVLGALLLAVLCIVVMVLSLVLNNVIPLLGVLVPLSPQAGSVLDVRPLVLSPTVEMVLSPLPRHVMAAVPML
jgi:hypothetical protein